MTQKVKLVWPSFQLNPVVFTKLNLSSVCEFGLSMDFRTSSLYDWILYNCLVQANDPPMYLVQMLLTHCVSIVISSCLLLQGMDDLAGCHKDQQTGMVSDIKVEMSAFQKKILSETVSSMLCTAKAAANDAQLVPYLYVATPRPIQRQEILADNVVSSLIPVATTNQKCIYYNRTNYNYYNKQNH